MSTHRTHLSAERRWRLAVVSLIVVLVATGCGGGLAVHAAVPDARGGASRETPQEPLPAVSVSAAALAAQDPKADSVLDAAALATYRVGQTAAVGDLRITLDKVVVSAGEAGNLPAAGQIFLFVYITVENNGKAAQLLSFFSTSVTDRAGRHYFVEPYAGYLSAAQPLVASIPPGGRMSGNRGYMLPANAGDLIWTGGDASHNRATFAISTTDIVALRQQ